MLIVQQLYRCTLYKFPYVCAFQILSKMALIADIQLIQGKHNMIDFQSIRKKITFDVGTSSSVSTIYILQNLHSHGVVLEVIRLSFQFVRGFRLTSLGAKDTFVFTSWFLKCQDSLM